MTAAVKREEMNLVSARNVQQEAPIRIKMEDDHGALPLPLPERAVPEADPIQEARDFVARRNEGRREEVGARASETSWLKRAWNSFTTWVENSLEALGVNNPWTFLAAVVATLSLAAILGIAILLPPTDVAIGLLVGFGIVAALSGSFALS